MPDQTPDDPTRVAVSLFWTNRSNQIAALADGGLAGGAARAGGHMDGIRDLVKWIFMDAGMPVNSIVYEPYLPGFYRPRKRWDMAVRYKGALVAALEFKSQVGSVVTEFLLRHVLSREGVVRALIAATITRPGQAHARPGLRLGLIDSALAPLDDTLGVTEPAALTQLKRDLAVVVSAEALFSLTDVLGLEPEEAIASIVHTAATLTRAALSPPRVRSALP